MTQRDLARQRRTAVQVRYGPSERAVGQEIAGQRQTGRDMTGWYSDYLAELEQHRANVAEQAKQQDAANQQLLASVVAGDAQRAQSNGGSQQVQKDAGAAGGVREQMLAAFAGQQAGQGRTSSGYADTLAHVVGPGQRLQAQAQNRRVLRAAKEKRTALKGDEGAYGQQYADQVVAGEAKNVLAKQALGLDVQKFNAGEQDKAKDRGIARTRIKVGQQTSHERIQAQKNAAAQRTADKKREATTKHVGEVRDTSRKGMARLHDIGVRVDTYSQEVRPDAVTKKPRKPTANEVTQQLIKDGFTAQEIHLAKKIHNHELLTSADVAAAHELGIRVPRALIESHWVSTRPTRLP